MKVKDLLKELEKCDPEDDLICEVEFPKVMVDRLSSVWVELIQPKFRNCQGENLVWGKFKFRIHSG